jgi:hypothetical protein
MPRAPEEDAQASNENRRRGGTNPFYSKNPNKKIVGFHLA